MQPTRRLTPNAAALCEELVFTGRDRHRKTQPFILSIQRSPVPGSGRSGAYRRGRMAHIWQPPPETPDAGPLRPVSQGMRGRRRSGPLRGGGRNNFLTSDQEHYMNKIISSAGGAGKAESRRTMTFPDIRQGQRAERTPDRDVS